MIFGLFLIGATLNSVAQDAFDAFFQSQQSDEHTIKLNLEGDFINMFIAEELKKEGNKDMSFESRVDQVKLLIYDNVADNKVVVKGLVSSFRDNGYDQLIQLREGKNTVEVFSKDNGDVITSAFAYITSDDNKMILAKVRGELSMSDLNLVIDKMSEN